VALPGDDGHGAVIPYQKTRETRCRVRRVDGLWPLHRLWIPTLSLLEMRTCPKGVVNRRGASLRRRSFARAIICGGSTKDRVAR